MSDSDVDYDAVDWEEQEGELEAIEMIFPEELEIKQSKPYKFEIKINSNAESEDNHLQILLIVDMPYNYPQKVPFMRLKNLTPDYLNNQMLD